MCLRVRRIASATPKTTSSIARSDELAPDNTVVPRDVSEQCHNAEGRNARVAERGLTEQQDPAWIVPIHKAVIRALGHHIGCTQERRRRE